MQPNYFCYVHSPTESVPLMLALDAETLPQATEGARLIMRDRPASAWAEVWDGERVVERITRQRLGD